MFILTFMVHLIVLYSSIDYYCVNKYIVLHRATISVSGSLQLLFLLGQLSLFLPCLASISAPFLAPNSNIVRLLPPHAGRLGALVD